MHTYIDTHMYVYTLVFKFCILVMQHRGLDICSLKVSAFSLPQRGSCRHTYTHTHICASFCRENAEERMLSVAAADWASCMNV